jgi:hypothetical protein
MALEGEPVASHMRRYEEGASMKRFFLAVLAVLSVAGVPEGATAQSNVTVHAQESFREGDVTRFTHFDVTLDARLITADEALYDPVTGSTELRGNVVAHLVAPAANYPFDLFAMEFHPEGDNTRLTHFNVELDGRQLSGEDGTYDPKAGVLTFNGSATLALPPGLANKMAPDTVH